MEKALERPGRRKYTKVDHPVKTEQFTSKDDSIGVGLTTVEEPVAAETDGADIVSEVSKEIVEAARKGEKTKSKRVTVINVGPVMEFLLRDSTIVVVFALLVFAITPTFMYWTSISQNRIPLSVSIGWVVAAYVVGEELGRTRGSRSVMFQDDTDKETVMDKSESAAERSHSIFMSAKRRFSQESSVRFVEEPPPPKRKRAKFWSAERFSMFRRRQKWRRNMKPSKSSALLQWINNDETLQPRPRGAPVRVEDDSLAEAAPVSLDTTMGAFDLNRSPAKSLAHTGVEPLLSLRGMDIFLPAEDGAQDQLGNHPFLIK